MMPNREWSVDFIGVGAEKSGTSWLFQCLAEHPKICGAQGKETLFFDTTKILGRPPRDKSNYEKYGVEFYKQYFRNCPPDLIKGEFTTTYLHDKNAAKRILEIFPNVKIIICLRNPIERTLAQYIAIQEWRWFKNFEDALKKEPEFIRRSFYADYVKEYLDLFPQKNIFIGIYEDIEVDPLKFIQSIYDFLGVDNNFVPPSVDKKIDTEEIKIITEFRNRIQKNDVINFLVKTAQITKLNRLIKKAAFKFIKKPAMRKGTHDYLQKIFAPDIQELERLISQDLSRWN